MAIAYDRYMTGTDALMHAFETDPRLRTAGCGVFLLDGTPDQAVVRDRFDRLSRTAPRFRQKVVELPWSTSPPRYVVDPDFDIDYHVRFIAVPGGGVRELLDWVQVTQVQDLDRHRAQWEATLVSGLAGGKSAVVFKASHTITDAVGGLAMIGSLFDLSAEQPELGALPEPPAGERPGSGDLLWDSMRSELGYAAEVGSGVLRTVPTVLRHPVGAVTGALAGVRSLVRVLGPGEPGSSLMSARSLSVHCSTFIRPMAPLKAAGKSAGGTLNHAFAAAVAGGLRRYHEQHDASATPLRMAMPVNVRSQRGTEQQAGNHWVVAKLPLPIDIVDPAQRIQRIKAHADAVLEEPGLHLFTPVTDALARLPRPVLTGALKETLASGIDVGTSNVPGPPFPMFFGGTQIESILLFGPIGGVSTNCTLTSYNGSVHLAIQGNTASIPDRELYLRCMEEGFDEVIALAGT